MQRIESSNTELRPFPDPPPVFLTFPRSTQTLNEPLPPPLVSVRDLVDPSFFSSLPFFFYLSSRSCLLLPLRGLSFFPLVKSFFFGWRIIDEVLIHIFFFFSFFCLSYLFRYSSILLDETFFFPDKLWHCSFFSREQFSASLVLRTDCCRRIFSLIFFTRLI